MHKIPYGEDGKCIACIQRASLYPKPKLSLGKVIAQLVAFAVVCAAGVFAYAYWRDAAVRDTEGSKLDPALGAVLDPDSAANKARDKVGSGVSAGELKDKLGNLIGPDDGTVPKWAEEPKLGAAMEKVSVTLYSDPSCNDCMRVRKYMEEHNVTFTEIDISKDPASQTKLAFITDGTRKVPTAVIDGQVYSGFVWDRFDWFMRKAAKQHL